MREQVVWLLGAALIVVLSTIAWAELRFIWHGHQLLNLVVVVFLLLACYAFIVVGFGHRFGSLGALFVALVILPVSTFAYGYHWIGGEFDPTHFGWTASEHFWRHVLASFYMLSILQLITAAPMFAAFRWPWLRRLAVGLAGAAVASLTLPLLGVMAVCEALHDCL